MPKSTMNGQVPAGFQPTKFQLHKKKRRMPYTTSNTNSKSPKARFTPKQPFPQLFPDYPIMNSNLINLKKKVGHRYVANSKQTTLRKRPSKSNQSSLERKQK